MHQSLHGTKDCLSLLLESLLVRLISVSGQPSTHTLDRPSLSLSSDSQTDPYASGNLIFHRSSPLSFNIFNLTTLRGKKQDEKGANAHWLICMSVTETIGYSKTARWIVLMYPCYAKPHPSCPWLLRRRVCKDGNLFE
jgi:hypothetical protein